MSIGSAMALFYQLIGVLIVISVTNWYIALALPVAGFIMLCLFKYAISGYKECVRIESVTKSPVLNQISETTSGGSTIKAFGNEASYEKKFFVMLNNNILAW